jgi:hypothetical protein
MIHPLIRPIFTPLTLTTCPPLNRHLLTLLLKRIVAPASLQLRLLLLLLFRASRVFFLQVFVPLLVAAGCDRASLGVVRRVAVDRLQRSGSLRGMTMRVHRCRILGCVRAPCCVELSRRLHPVLVIVLALVALDRCVGI